MAMGPAPNLRDGERVPGDPQPPGWTHHRTHNKGGPLGSEWSHLFGLSLLKKKITNFVADMRDSSCLHLVSIMSSFGWEVGVQAEFKGSCCLCCPRQKGLDRVKDLLGLACRTQARLQTPQLPHNGRPPPTIPPFFPSRKDFSRHHLSHWSTALPLGSSPVLSHVFGKPVPSRLRAPTWPHTALASCW